MKKLSYVAIPLLFASFAAAHAAPANEPESHSVDVHQVKDVNDDAVEIAHAEKHEHQGVERPEKAERPERPERPEKLEAPEHAGGADK